VLRYYTYLYTSYFLTVPILFESFPILCRLLCWCCIHCLCVSRDLARLHRRKYRGPVEIYVTNGDTIYITDAEKTFSMTSVLSQAEDEGDACGKEVCSPHKGEGDLLRRGTNRHLERRHLEGSSTHEKRESESKGDPPPPPPAGPVQVTLTPFGRDLAHFPSDLPKSAAGEHYQGNWTSEVTGTATKGTCWHMHYTPVNIVFCCTCCDYVLWVYVVWRVGMTCTEEVPRAHDPFHDPLLNPPPRQKKDDWPGSLLVLIPLRLGLDKISPHYFEVRRCVIR
jgi:hypothetical protein